MLLLLVLAGTGCGEDKARVASASTPSAGQAPTLKLKEGAKNIGILIFDQVFITEFVAPLDVYKHISGGRVNVFLVAPTMAPITTYEGVQVAPNFSFANAPKIDILVVPSGNNSKSSDLQNATFIEFVKKTAATADKVTSHCWGAFTLAQAGVLDGKDATTFPTSNEDLAKAYPTVKVATDRRFVEDGNVITSNGGLAAFEAALAVVEKLYGADEANSVAKGLVFAPQNVEFSRNPSLALDARSK